MKKTRVYIDGYNLYYGLLKGTPWKWLDLELFSRVLVFNPHTGLSQHLKRAASYYKNIPRDLPAKCQLPDEIPVGTHGNVIRRPAAWR